MKKFIDLIPFILIFLLISILSFSALYFTGIITFGEKNDYNLVFNCDDFTMEVGSNITLEAYVKENKDSEIKWESSDTDILTVKDGIVTSKKEGKAIITATSVAHNKSDVCTVTVKKEIINVSSIELDKTEISLIEEESYKINAKVKPENASNKNIIWETSDSKVAEVSDGKIIAKGHGTATITAKSSDGTKNATCIVTVIKKETEVPVSKVELDKEQIELYVGDTFGVNVTIEPTDATNKNVTWKSSNTKVAEVSVGKITAKGKGTATITVSSENGKTDKLTITVKEKPKENIEVTGISITPNTLTLKVKEEYNLNTTITPSNATNKKVTWTSSNTSVATITDGKVVAKGKGTTTITATTQNGKKATIEVVVKENETPKPSPEQPTTVQVTNITLNKTTLILNIGNTETLTTNITPSNATNKTITWKSRNTNVATVSNGVITAKGAGTATIIATTSNGKTAQCTVEVKQQVVGVEVTGISLNKTQPTIVIGNSINVEAIITPSNATNKVVNWSSSNTGVAAVENVVNGTIKGVGLGTATITATTSNGKSASFIVKVIPNVSPIKLSNKQVGTYKAGIILYDPANSKVQKNMQDFDITKIGTADETFYFIATVRGVLDGTATITNEQKQELLTPIVYKVPKANLGNTKGTPTMYLKRSGQGQFISKEPNTNYFWTSGNPGIVCSGAGCSYDNNSKKYSCSNANTCTWWGGNNSNISRIKFTKNSYGDDITIDRYHNFGTIQQKRIAVWTAFDWENNLMAAIATTENKVYVYNAKDAINGTKTLLYEFTLPKGFNESSKSYSTQGFALNGGYLYRLRGNYNQGIWIEVFDMYGNYIEYSKYTTGQENNRVEAQGMKIYNNRIYFGVLYRHNCNLSAHNGKCAPDAVDDIRNTIYYLK